MSRYRNFYVICHGQLPYTGNIWRGKILANHPGKNYWRGKFW